MLEPSSVERDTRLFKTGFGFVDGGKREAKRQFESVLSASIIFWHRTHFDNEWHLRQCWLIPSSKRPADDSESRNPATSVEGLSAQTISDTLPRDSIVVFVDEPTLESVVENSRPPQLVYENTVLGKLIVVAGSAAAERRGVIEVLPYLKPEVVGSSSFVPVLQPWTLRGHVRDTKL